MFLWKLVSSSRIDLGSGKIEPFSGVSIVYNYGVSEVMFFLYDLFSLNLKKIAIFFAEFVPPSLTAEYCAPRSVCAIFLKFHDSGRDPFKF